MWWNDATLLEIAGRILLPVVFVVVGLFNLSRKGIEDHIHRLTVFKAPFPALTFWIGIALQFASSALVWFASGQLAVYGVYGLMLFLVLASALLLRFWQVDDPMRRTIMRNAMMSNISVFGGLCLLLSQMT